MLKRKLLKIGMGTVLLIGSLCFMVTNSFAVSQNLQAAVDLQQAISFAAATPINFGTVVPPTSGGGNTITMDPNGGVTLTGSGNAITLIGGPRGPGSIQLNVPIGSTINLSATGGSCSDPKLSIGSFTFVVNPILPADCTDNICNGTHGASLTIQDNPLEGAQTCAYTINANF